MIVIIKFFSLFNKAPKPSHPKAKPVLIPVENDYWLKAFEALDAHSNQIEHHNCVEDLLSEHGVTLSKKEY